MDCCLQFVVIAGLRSYLVVFAVDLCADIFEICALLVCVGFVGFGFASVWVWFWVALFCGYFWLCSSVVWFGCGFYCRTDCWKMVGTLVPVVWFLIYVLTYCVCLYLGFTYDLVVVFFGGGLWVMVGGLPDGFRLRVLTTYPVFVVNVCYWF